MRNLLYLLLLILLGGCSKKSGIEIVQNKRDNIINVHDKIKEIEIDSLLFSSSSTPYIMEDYLLIADYRSYDQFIHIFNKNDFHYITGIAYMGQGPGEITEMGYVGINEACRKIEVTDFGKQMIFSFDLDSALNNPSYMPQEKIKIYGDKLLHQYKYINESTCIGLIMEPIGSSDFKMSVGTQNMNNGEFKVMPYTHPEVKKKRVSFAVSPENGIYVECYEGQNLITICSLDGRLKHNVYGGSNWKENQRGRIEYYRKAAFVQDKIFALYLEDYGIINQPARGLVGNLATKFLVFDLTGNYLATLETSYRISSFCYDEENNRIVFSFNDDIQFGYLDLDGII